MVEVRHIAVFLALAACTSSPEGYDYHGGNQDAVDSTPWTPLDARLPDVAPDRYVPDVVPEQVVAPDTGLDLVQIDPDLQVPIDRVASCTWKLEFVPPDGSQPSVAGEFTGWTDSEIPLEDSDGNGVWTLELDMSPYDPGSYGYKFHTATDNWYLDPENPMAKWVDAVENSKLIVPDCRVPELSLKQYSVDADKGLVDVVVEVSNPAKSAGLFPASAAVKYNGKQHPAGYDAQAGLFSVQLPGLADETKATLVFTIENEFGASLPLYVPLWVSKQGWQWRDAALYFAFTDRFANGNIDNDGPSDCTDTPLTDWNGGDFSGIRQKVEDDYFTDMGINVLWLSPVIDNPNGCYDGSLPGVSYTAYHGYFPLDITTTEDHFGTLQELVQLVDSAHSRGIRVIVDFVGNHVHSECLLWQEHGADGWFHSFNSCQPNWDKPIECWFQPYLPDLDYTNDQVVELMTDNAVWWVMATGVDGFRVDAVKHMVHNFMYTLRWKLARHVETTDVVFYMVGETFMGKWGGGTGMAETVIKEYVNPGELNGQFDFPFYWELLETVGRDEGDFEQFAQFLVESDGFYGPDALMASFMGNHDVPRFISHAAGDIADLWGNGSKEQGMTAPPEQPEAKEPYDRAALALGLLFTLPEIPLVYYGDEVGLAGAGDPDNRRVMPWDGLNAHQMELLDFARSVGKIRRDNAPLRRGTLGILAASQDLLAFKRTWQGQALYVVANRQAGATEASVPLAGLGDTTLVDLLTGQKVEAAQGLASIALDPFGLVILKEE